MKNIWTAAAGVAAVVAMRLREFQQQLDDLNKELKRAQK